jgi:hypothetical protein
MANTPIPSSNSSQPRLIIGNETVSQETVADKMRQDIHFLSNRIAQLHAQNNPNPNVLKVYQDMLDSRYAILTWLEHSQKRSA